MPFNMKAPPQWPYGALSVPIATDYRELSAVLLRTELNSTARQTIQFNQPVQVVGFFAQVRRWSFAAGGLLVPTNLDVMVAIDLDDKTTFTSQENNQIFPGKWVTLDSQTLNAAVLRMIQPRNRSPVFGVSFRWAVPASQNSGNPIFEDALVAFGAYINYPEGE